jgi:hypothetical protein
VKAEDVAGVLRALVQAHPSLGVSCSGTVFLGVPGVAMIDLVDRDGRSWSCVIADTTHLAGGPAYGSSE